MEELFLTNTKNNIYNYCNICELYKNCNSPKMKVTGKGKKRILVVAEAPGKLEDEQGKQLIGKAGKYLRKILDEINIDLDNDCWKTNAVICRPQNNKTPTDKQINNCRTNLINTIEELKPEKIITLGKTALKSLLGDKTSITSMDKWYGWNIPDQDYNVWIYPTFHPAYLLRNIENTILEKTFKEHLKKAFLNAIPFPDFSLPKIEIFGNSIEAVIFLESLLSFPESIAIDFETTGKKPFNKEHEIICISISTKNKNICFPIFKDLEFKKILRKVLTNPDIKKIGHNIKFENLWSKRILGYFIHEWEWDTMIASHIIDNRTGITGLKFQTYINFGIINYDKDVEKYIESKETHGLNNIKRVDIKKVMEYCGYDSYYTYKLAEKQKKKLKNKRAYNLFHKGIIELSKIENNGIQIDSDYYQKKYNQVGNKIQKLDKEIKNMKENLLWKKKNGSDININSNTQLSTLFFDILNIKPEKFTDGGNPSTDMESLTKIKNPFAEKIINIRKLIKTKETYLKGFLKEGWENKIYPSFNLHVARSYRSSSSSPNFQNYPKRDKKIQRLVRYGIKPSPNNYLMEVDYAGIEVRISACYHKDKNMVYYINDSSTDMHRDQAIKIFKKKEVTKEERYLAKNNFVFPQFYGDYYKNCAVNIWNKMEKENKEKFKKYSVFENHIKKIEDEFWNDLFFEYKIWKEKTYNNYLKNGYIRTLTGFKFIDLMKKNDVLNRPIQGTAFHCLLWSLIELSQHFSYYKYKSKIIGQIHDSIVFDIIPEELEDIKILVRRVMCEDIREYWKWIIVPLDIDAELSSKNWYEMKEEEI